MPYQPTEEEIDAVAKDLIELADCYRRGKSVVLTDFSLGVGRSQSWATNVLCGYSLQKEAMKKIELKDKKWLAAIRHCAKPGFPVDSKDVAAMVALWDKGDLAQAVVDEWETARNKTKSDQNNKSRESQVKATNKKREQLLSDVRHDPAPSDAPLAGFEVRSSLPSNSGAAHQTRMTAPYPPSVTYAAYAYPQAVQYGLQQSGPSASRTFAPEGYGGRVHHTQGHASTIQNIGPAEPDQYLDRWTLPQGPPTEIELTWQAAAREWAATTHGAAVHQGDESRVRGEFILLPTDVQDAWMAYVSKASASQGTSSLTQAAQMTLVPAGDTRSRLAPEPAPGTVPARPANLYGNTAGR